MAEIPLEAQIACVRREVIRRAEITPEEIATGRTTWAVAKYEQEAMTAVLQTLLAVKEIRRQPGHVQRSP